MDYNGPPASEYRLNIDGISVFCPCGEFLWVFDGSSIDILRVHIRKCRIYKGVKNFKYDESKSVFRGHEEDLDIYLNKDLKQFREHLD